MESYPLPIHFEILDNKHEVSSVTLNVFIEAYKEIFEELFEEKIEIKIGVPEEGSLKVVLTVLGLIGAGVSFVGIDNLSILFRGKDSKDIFLAGNKYITEFISKKADETPDEYPRKCVEQKNKIYKRFQDDKCITSFDLDKLPPIPRNNFNLYIKELPEESSLYCGEAKILVNSPVWKGSSKRAWTGEIDILDNEKVAFDFDKDLTGKFWEKIKLNAIFPTSGFDVMNVQLIKRPNNKPQYRVIRVLSYNEKEIDSSLSDEIISRITSGVIEKDDSTETKNPQMNFFELLESNNK